LLLKVGVEASQCKNEKRGSSIEAAIAFSFYTVKKRDLFGELKYAAAEIEHEQKRRQKKQSHKNVENAVAFAARVLDVVHICLKLCVVQKVGQK